MRTLAVVSGGLRQPSSTRLLADRLADAVVRAVREHGEQVTVEVIELRELAHDVTNTLLTGFASPALRVALDTVTSADGVVAVTPTFSGAYSGMFKNFFDVVDEDALNGVPVLLAATAGTARHSLTLEHTVRPLFAYLGAVTVPTAVFAATEDFGRSGGSTTQDGTPLAARVERAAGELASLMVGRPSRSRKASSGRLETVDFTDLLAGG